jgi:hypothetical protein
MEKYLKELLQSLEKICKPYNIKIKYIVRKKQFFNFPIYFYSYYFYNGVISKKLKYYCSFVVSEYKGDILYGSYVPGKKIVLLKLGYFKIKKDILALAKKFIAKNYKRF